MSRKGFLVKVELDVQKVSCPGVCLCSNGKVSLQIHMFGSSVQTRNCRPVFPLAFYEKFVFSKIFDQDRRLNELQRRLNQEYIYAELIQWKSCDEGRVLSTFRTTLDDLLYPSTFRGSIMGVNIDLLMEPTDIFPGTIAPKLEVGTKTTVEEKLVEPYCTDPSITLITPKALACKPAVDNRSVPRKVCHSIGYSRSQKKDKEAKRKIKKPPFKFGKVPDDLILRTNPNVVVKDYFNEKFSNKPTCYCSEGKHVDYGPEDLYNNIENCDTRTEILKHKKDCSTCSFYDNYFSRNPSRVQSNGTRYSANVGTKVPSHVCSYCSRHLNNSSKYHVPSKTGSPCDSDPEYIDSKGKICFCIPREPTNSLAQQLHEKLVRTLENNSRLLQKYIDC